MRHVPEMSIADATDAGLLQRSLLDRMLCLHNGLVAAATSCGGDAGYQELRHQVCFWVGADCMYPGSRWRQLMGVVQLPDELKLVIDRQIAEGRAASEADFLIEAVQRYAEALELDEAEIVAAADEGVADIEAGRFDLISGPEDMERLQADLSATLDQLAEQRGSALR